MQRPLPLHVVDARQSAHARGAFRLTNRSQDKGGDYERGLGTRNSQVHVGKLYRLSAHTWHVAPLKAAAHWQAPVDEHVPRPPQVPAGVHTAAKKQANT